MKIQYGSWHYNLATSRVHQGVFGLTIFEYLVLVLGGIGYAVSKAFSVTILLLPAVALPYFHIQYGQWVWDFYYSSNIKMYMANTDVYLSFFSMLIALVEIVFLIIFALKIPLSKTVTIKY